MSSVSPFSNCSVLMSQGSKYLSDPTEDVRVATENILADFLRELRDVTIIQKKAKRDAGLSAEQPRRPDGDKDKLTDITLANSDRGVFITEAENGALDDISEVIVDDKQSEQDTRDAGRKFFHSEFQD